MSPHDPVETRISSLQGEIEHQRKIVADRRQRGRPVEADEQLLFEMVSVLHELQQDRMTTEEASRLKILAAQCRNLANSVSRQEARDELQRMAMEYEHKASAIGD